MLQHASALLLLPCWRSARAGLRYIEELPMARQAILLVTSLCFLTVSGLYPGEHLELSWASLQRVSHTLGFVQRIDGL